MNGKRYVRSLPQGGYRASLGTILAGGYPEAVMLDFVEPCAPEGGAGSLRRKAASPWTKYACTWSHGYQLTWRGMLTLVDATRAFGLDRDLLLLGNNHSRQHEPIERTPRPMPRQADIEFVIVAFAEEPLAQTQIGALVEVAEDQPEA